MCHAITRLEVRVEARVRHGEGERVQRLGEREREGGPRGRGRENGRRRGRRGARRRVLGPDAPIAQRGHRRARAVVRSSR